MSFPSLQSWAAVVGAASFISLYFVLGALGRLEGTPLPTIENRATLAHFFPQKWAFFTKAPSSDRMHVYHQQGGSWSEISLVNRLDIGSGFGLHRANRAASRQLGQIAQEMLPIEWFECEHQLTDCLSDPPVAAVVNDLHAGFGPICGQMAIVVQAPVPWEWRNNTVTMPTRFARFEVPCTAS